MAKAAKPSAKAAPKKRADQRGTPKATGTVRPKHGGKIGNPPFKPTEHQRRHVMLLSATGSTIPMIAQKIGVSERTIERHFRQELDEGLPYANAELGGVLYNGALAGDAKKLEMWFDRRGGTEWRKKSGVELSGPGGAPIEYRDLSDDELNARIKGLLGDNATGATE